MEQAMNHGGQIGTAKPKKQRKRLRRRRPHDLLEAHDGARTARTAPSTHRHALSGDKQASLFFPGLARPRKMRCFARTVTRVTAAAPELRYQQALSTVTKGHGRSGNIA
jgi:hypothetical protein